METITETETETEIKFKCSECGDNQLEEVLTGVTVSSIVDYIDKDGYTEYGDHVENNGGEVSRYQCINCGYVLVDDDDGTITDSRDLATYLKNTMLKVN